MLRVAHSGKWRPNRIRSAQLVLVGSADVKWLEHKGVEMEIGKGFSRSNSLIARAVQYAAIMVALLTAPFASAQNEYWPVATLQPPGLDAQLTPIAGVALAGDFAVTVYKPTPTLGYRVFLRKRNAQGWDAPQLLVQGQPGEGENVAVSADADHIAIGLRKSDTNGRVDVYVRNGNNWNLQQAIPAAQGAGPVTGPSPNFGYVVSLRQSLLTVSSGDLTFTSQFDTYRFDSASAGWILAGYSAQSVTSTKLIARTDGQRVAACYQTNCSSVLHDGNGNFSSEGGFPASSPTPTDFEIDGDWFFVRQGTGLNAYQRSGITWTMRQQFSEMGSFALSGEKLVVVNSPTVNFYSVDPAGVWQLTATRESPSGMGGTALNPSFALSGIQSFNAENGPWLATGTVDGVADVASFRFGAAVSLAANRVWIGSPRHNEDFASGAIWMEPLDGNSAAFPRFIDAPSFSASGVGFGQVIATDGARVAVVSLPDYLAAPLKIRIYSATSLSPVVADITAPPTVTRASVVDVAIDGSTMVLFRRLSGAAEALVYVDSGAGYVLNQTIALTLSAVSKVMLRGDLLNAGQMQFQRTGGLTGNFSPIDPIVNPPGVVLNFSRMARYGSLLVIAANFPGAAEPIARIFSITQAGWAYSGDITRGAFTDASCFYPTAATFPMGGINMIACVTGTTLSIATPNTVGNNWTVMRSAAVPGVTSGPFSINGVAMEGDHVAIGEPGQSRVTVVDVTESIFSGGFDQ